MFNEIKFGNAEQCYNGCICDMLQREGYYVDEEAVFLKNNPILSMYMAGYGLCSDIERTVNTFCNQFKLQINPIGIINELDDLKRFLSIRGCILCNVNSKQLVYEKAFVSGVSGSHYINILDILSDSKLLVKDCYIPTRPISSYFGELPVSDLFFKSATFWEYEISKLVLGQKYEILQEDIIGLKGMFVLELEGAEYENWSIGKKAKLLYLNEIEQLYELPDSKLSEKAYKMATSIIVNGAIGARKYLLKAMLKLNLEYKYLDALSSILNNYYMIQLVLVKISFNKSKEEIRRLRGLYMKIMSEEEKLCIEMLQLLSV